MSTPERKGRLSAVTTPTHSRRSSRRLSKTPNRTPNRTPSRRRATIVSASLITPRRGARLASSSPYKALKSLSQAFKREQAEQEQPDQVPLDPASPDHDVFYSDFDMEEDYDKVPVDSDVAQPSDIALPVAMMPELMPESDGETAEIGDLDEFNEADITQEVMVENDDTASDLKESKKAKIKVKRAINIPRPISITPRLINAFSKQILHKSLSAQSLEVLSETTNLFFTQIADDLLAYTDHSKRRNIDLKSIILLLKRQRKIHNIEGLLEIIDLNLPLEDVLEIRRNIIKL